MHWNFLLKIKKHIRIAFLLITTLLISISILPTKVHGFEAEEELERLRQEQEKLVQQLEEAQSNLSAFESDLALQESNISWLLERDSEQRIIYEQKIKQIAALVTIKQSLDKSLETAVYHYEKMKSAYSQRIGLMYQLSRKSHLELLLESDNLEGYFTALKMMKMIADADEQELEELRQIRDRIQTQRESTINELAMLEEIQIAMEADLRAIKLNIELSQSNVSSLGAEKQELLDAVAMYTERDFQLRLDIEATEAELTEQKRLASEQSPIFNNAEDNLPDQFSAQNTDANGSFIWPVPSCWEISSEFGWRDLPELGIPDFHSGIDIPANWNAEVMASASGTVVFAGWYNEYGGNTVRIDVGGGITLMYCHLADFAVSTGDYVSAGQTIGFVGSTGLSTGPHLHFEIQDGGASVDPLLYIG